MIEAVEAVLSAPRPWSVVQVGDPVLRAPAQRFEGQLPLPILGRLLDAMRAHLPGVGVGLAAPQIGIPLAVAVIEDVLADEEVERVPQPLLELINPVLTPLDDDMRAYREACLSLAGFTAVVARHRRVRLDALDRSLRPYSVELTGWAARIAQHETDHLDGTLYIDRADLRSFSTI